MAGSCEIGAMGLRLDRIREFVGGVGPMSWLGVPVDADIWGIKFSSVSCGRVHLAESGEREHPIMEAILNTLSRLPL